MPYLLVISLEFLISNINFEKPLLVFFLIDDMCHKTDNPILKQKIEWSIKRLVVDLYLISLDVSIHGRPQTSIAAIFRQSAFYVLNFYIIVIGRCKKTLISCRMTCLVLISV